MAAFARALQTVMFAQVYVAWLDGGTAVFAFRGTESSRDAMTDADARYQHVPWLQETYPHVRAHMGAFSIETNLCAPQSPVSTGVIPSLMLACLTV